MIILATTDIAPLPALRRQKLAGRDERVGPTGRCADESCTKNRNVIVELNALIGFAHQLGR